MSAKSNVRMKPTEARPLDVLAAAYLRVVDASDLTVRLSFDERSGSIHVGERRLDVEVRLEVYVGNVDSGGVRVGIGIGATVDEAAEAALKTLRGRGAAV